MMSRTCASQYSPRRLELNFGEARPPWALRLGVEITGHWHVPLAARGDPMRPTFPAGRPGDVVHRFVWNFDNVAEGDRALKVVKRLQLQLFD